MDALTALASAFDSRDAAAWDAVCRAAEAALDQDGAAFEALWLPAAQERLAGWPPALRRCPPRWFATPRGRIDLLLQLGEITAEETATWGGVRHPAVGPYGNTWTLWPDGNPEAYVSGLAPPDAARLRLFQHVIVHLPRLEAQAAAILHRLAEQRGPRDPFILGGEVAPGQPRYRCCQYVKLVAPYAVDVFADDQCHTANDWPYGTWRVSFEWGRVVRASVGDDRYNHVVWDAGGSAAKPPRAG